MEAPVCGCHVQIGNLRAVVSQPNLPSLKAYKSTQKNSLQRFPQHLENLEDREVVLAAVADEGIALQPLALTLVFGDWVVVKIIVPFWVP